MNRNRMFGAAAAAFVVSLFVWVSFGEGGPEVALGDEACADTTGSCQEDCDLQQEACVKMVKKVTEVSKCFECCKKTEDEGRVGLDTTPTRDELHQYMLDKCVLPVSVRMSHPDWVRGFPTEHHAAEAFQPKQGPIGEALNRKFPHRETSEPNTGRGRRAPTSRRASRAAPTARGTEWRCATPCTTPAARRRRGRLRLRCKR